MTDNQNIVIISLTLASVLLLIAFWYCRDDSKDTKTIQTSVMSESQINAIKDDPIRFEFMKACMSNYSGGSQERYAFIDCTEQYNKSLPMSRKAD